MQVWILKCNLPVCGASDLMTFLMQLQVVLRKYPQRHNKLAVRLKLHAPCAARPLRAGRLAGWLAQLRGCKPKTWLDRLVIATTSQPW